LSGGYIALGQEEAHADAESFDALFVAHRDYVYGLTYALLGDPQDAEDVTQEVFLQVYRSLATYRPERASFRTWLASVAVNASRRYRKRRQKSLFVRLFGREQTENENGDVNDGDAAPALIDLSVWGVPEDRVLQEETRHAVKAVIDRLRPEHRTVLVLHYYLDLSCPDIARIINCPEGTVYSRLHYARRAVRKRLESRLPELQGEVGR
jgi:RNA polymerase sigma-70 factor, ECF subfamily